MYMYQSTLLCKCTNIPNLLHLHCIMYHDQNRVQKVHNTLPIKYLSKNVIIIIIIIWQSPGLPG